MQNPRNLLLWERSLDLATAVYRTTSSFPRDERFGLTSQMRRASVSVGSNISEGCGRDGDRDFLRFLHNAMGSSTELEFQLALAGRLAFAAPEELRTCDDTLGHTQRMLTKLITVVRTRSECRAATARPERAS